MFDCVWQFCSAHFIMFYYCKVSLQVMWFYDTLMIFYNNNSNSEIYCVNMWNVWHVNRYGPWWGGLYLLFTAPPCGVSRCFLHHPVVWAVVLHHPVVRGVVCHPVCRHGPWWGGLYAAVGCDWIIPCETASPHQWSRGSGDDSQSWQHTQVSAATATSRLSTLLA